jgi:hypothetical protein
MEGLIMSRNTYKYSETTIDMIKIGEVDVADGIDTYYLLVNKEDNFYPFDDGAYNWFLERVYYNTCRPGGWFCSGVTVQNKLHHDNQMIAICHHRKDV